MRGLGIRNRLLLLALLPGVVIALILFGYFTRGQLDLANQSLHERGLTIARQLAPASEYGFITGNSELLGQLSRALLKQSDIIGVSIADTQHHAIFSEGTLDASRQLPATDKKDATLCSDQGNRLLFCAPIVKTQLQVTDYPTYDIVEPQVIGSVYVEMSTASLQRQRSGIISRAVLLTGALLLLSGVIAVRVGQGIAGPILRMTTTVGKVARGQLDLQTRSGVGGEIGMLEQGIDAMTIALRAARDEMQANIDNATQQVRFALRELETKNRDLDEQRMKAQAANEAKSRFLANMSHEIRTPLSGMVGLLFLLRHTHPSEEQQEYLENLESSAATLRTLIDDILDLSRIEAGRLVIHEQEFDIRRQLGSIASMLAPSAHEKNIELIVHVERDVPLWVMGDPMRLRQVLTNLLGNAIKFTEQGYVRLRLSCLTDNEARCLIIRFVVEDSGIGIATEKLDYIFESFAQADESTTRRYGGSGLGTTISRELVGLMGGTLRVTSLEGQGTSFIFDLPMGGSDTGETQRSQLADTSLLLLDEYPLSAEAERVCLERYGFLVDAVATEQALLEKLRTDKERFSFVLMAENSRESKWHDLALKLRQESLLKEGGLLIHLTFYDGDNIASLFDITQHKPLDGEALTNRVEDMLHEPKAENISLAEQPSYYARPLAILLAEDDPINAKVMSFFLSQKGHEVVLAKNGVEALEQLHSHPFDLAFLDMRMPETDGLMVARQWRGSEREGEHLPLIAVTANATREDRNACFDAGMDDFVSKPVDPDRLQELLMRYMQRRSGGRVS